MGGRLRQPDLHAIAILFARDATESGRCQAEHDKLVAQCEALIVGLGSDAPIRQCARPFRLSRPVLAISHQRHRRDADTWLRRSAQAGEFILGYLDEEGPPANLPQPEILSRNGSYMGLPSAAGACGQVS